MDVQNIAFVTAAIVLYAATILTFAIVGNVIVHHKTSKVADLLYPFSKDYGHNFGTRDRPALIYFLYYILFFAALAFLSLEIMSLRSSFRSWMNKLMGVDQAGGLSPASSHSSLSDQEASASKTESASASASETSLNAKSSKIKKKKAAKEKKKAEKKPKVPNVMRSSVVDPKNQVIPSLPRLSMKEDTSEKLSRVLSKIDDIDDSHDEDLGHLEDITPPTTPPSKQKKK